MNYTSRQGDSWRGHDHGLTPLMIAVRNDNVPMVRFLSQQPKIDVNLAGRNNGMIDAPLNLAFCSSKKDMEIARLLLDAGADPWMDLWRHSCQRSRIHPIGTVAMCGNTY